MWGCRLFGVLLVGSALKHPSQQTSFSFWLPSLVLNEFSRPSLPFISASPLGRSSGALLSSLGLFPSFVSLRNIGRSFPRHCLGVGWALPKSSSASLNAPGHQNLPKLLRLGVTDLSESWLPVTEMSCPWYRSVNLFQIRRIDFYFLFLFYFIFLQKGAGRNVCALPRELLFSSRLLPPLKAFGWCFFSGRGRRFFK